MTVRYLIPRQGGGFVAPEFEAPEWDETKISGLAQAAAAPGVRQLRRGLQTAIPRGYSPWDVQGRRAAIEGYGGGLAQVMGGARAAGAAQYGQQYGREFEAAKLGYGGQLQKAQADWQAQQAQAGREWETGERVGGQEWRTGEALAGRGWQTGERIGTQAWQTGEAGAAREAGYGEAARERAWQTGEAKAGRAGEFGLTRYKLTGQTPSLGGFGTTAGIGRRAKGGSVVPQRYLVGEEGTEMFEANDGSPRYPVGTQGPEVRTFPEPGQIIPNPRTMARQEGGPVGGAGMQISYDPPPPLSEEDQAAFDTAMEKYRKTYPQDFEVAPENIEAEREGMLIKRQYGGWVHGPEQEKLRQQVESEKYRAQLKQFRSGGGKGQKSAGLPMQQKIMQYLTATRMDPSGAGHMPYWQFMLQAQPEKLAGLLSYMRGGEPSFGRAGGTGPARKLSTREGFVSERQGVGKSPSGPGTEGPGAYAKLRGFTAPSRI